VTPASLLLASLQTRLRLENVMRKIALIFTAVLAFSPLGIAQAY